METKCPPTDEQIKIDWHRYNGILFSLKKKKILPFATTWIKLEDIMLSETNQTQKEGYFISMWNLKKSNLERQRVRGSRMSSGKGRC
jgi:hypothetical protein